MRFARKRAAAGRRAASPPDLPAPSIVRHHGLVAPLVISIPDPCLVVLVGAAGAGKSTLVARHFSPNVVLSSDGFREVVSGDAGDQRATKVAFAILHRQLERRLAD